MNWLKDCELCNAGLCKAVNERKEKGMGEREACRDMSAETNGLYSENAILQRYRYHTGKKTVCHFDTAWPTERPPWLWEHNNQYVYCDAFPITGPLEDHPASAVFPDMSTAEFDGLKESIRENGLRSPIVLFEGKILDGRQRYRACRAVKAAIWAQEFEGGMSELEYIVSANMYRSHYSPSQLAIAEARKQELVEKYQLGC